MLRILFRAGFRWIFLVLLFSRVGSAQDAAVAAGPAATATAGTATAVPMTVHLSVRDSSLTSEELLAALSREFQAPVTLRNEETPGLSLDIQARKVHAKFQKPNGESVERTLDLPQDRGKQIDTIVLLAGNLARDDAEQLLLGLRSSGSEPQAGQGEGAVPAEASEPSEASEKGEKEGEEKAESASEKEKGAESSESTADIEAEADIETTEVSFSFYRHLAWPKDLREKRTRFELGLVYGEIGSLEGAGLNVIALKNRGLGKSGAGKGAQMATFWVDQTGEFEGFAASAGVVWARGGIRGAQAAGIFQRQMGPITGAQVTGVLSLADQEIHGFQGSGVASIAQGEVRGAQLSGALSLSTEKVDGMQGAVVAVAKEMQGTQAGVVTVSSELKGVQVGVVNYGGDFTGTQVGVLNLGGRAKGTQVGLVNVARDLDGTPVGVINLIPGVRNQLVAFATYSPGPNHIDLPENGLFHVGWKVMPGPFYTQLSFGLGQSATPCSGANASENNCVGQVAYSPGFALGVRGVLAGDLFAEVDLNYQFERTFSQSAADRHALIARAALGYEITPAFAVVGGAGPRLNLRQGPDLEIEPEVSFAPHFFLGIQVF